MALNKVMLIGNVGKDPEVRHLESGAVTASFTLATSERFKDRNGETRDNTEWHNIVCWRGLAEIAEKYIKKGNPLYVEGRIRYRSYVDRDGNNRYITEILADNMQMLGRKGDNNDYHRESQQNQYSAPMNNTPVQPTKAEISNAGDDLADDDLPF